MERRVGFVGLLVDFGVITAVAVAAAAEGVGDRVIWSFTVAL